MVFWPGDKISKFITQPPGIKIGPNGVELSIKEVWHIPEDAEAFFHGEERTTKKVLVQPDSEGYYNLGKGLYEVRIANEIQIPENCLGLMFPRSSINRLGMVKSETALWDSGYKGFGTQTVFIPIKSFKIHKDEFWFQLAFINAENFGVYNGHWQGEK